MLDGLVPSLKPLSLSILDWLVFPVLVQREKELFGLHQYCIEHNIPKHSLSDLCMPVLCAVYTYLVFISSSSITIL